MYNLRNKVQLIGRVGIEPEIVNFESGKKIAKFRLATSEFFINEKGERKEQTEWHNVIFWNKPAEIVEKHLHKGREIAIEGKLTTRTWEDKEGKTQYTTEVVGRELLFLGSQN